MSKMNPEIKALWVAALKSGEYKQAHGYLKVKASSEEAAGYCCLGVLCELAAKAGLDIKTGEKVVDCGVSGCNTCEDNGRVTYKFDNQESYPPLSVMKWARLPYQNPRVIYGESPSADSAGEVSLASLNDVDKFDFNQIADIIDAQL